VSEVVAVDAVVHGRVQGVFFRASCQDEARALGVHGSVSNAADGTVQAHLEGSAEDVAAMVAWLHQGPRHAVVERVDVRDVPPHGSADFEVR
jgi:acylphosphatase